MALRLDYDQIAAQIHGFYENYPANVYQEFDRLSEFLKNDNRDAAMRIVTVLAAAGLRLEGRKDQAWSQDDQKAVGQEIEENIALLAEAEHDGWVESRIRNGWVLGTHRDIDKRESHLLTSYTKLREQIERKQKADGPVTTKEGRPLTLDEEVEAEKEKDRQSVKNYVAIIAGTDYKIVQEAGFAELP